MKRWQRLKLEGRVGGDKARFWVLVTILNFGFFVIHIHFVHSTFSQVVSIRVVIYRTAFLYATFPRPSKRRSFVSGYVCLAVAPLHSAI